MFIQYRQKPVTARDWAKNLGLEFDATLSMRSLKRFSSHTDTDRRWIEIRQRLAPGSRILDAGCGMGQWVWYLRQNGMNSIGLDFSDEMIDILKTRMPSCAWIHGTVQDIPLPDGSLDAIISWGVIEHDESGPQSALAEFFRKIRPAGYIFVTTPRDTPKRRKSSAVQFRVTKENGVFFEFFFTEQEIRDLLERVGFEVELVVPISRSYAVLFPRLYKITRHNRLVSALARRITAPLLALIPASAGMVLAIARKP